MSRLAFAVRRFGGDLLVVAGLCPVAYGAGQFADVVVTKADAHDLWARAL